MSPEPALTSHLAPAFSPLVGTHDDCNAAIRQRLAMIPNGDPRKPLLRALSPDLVRAMCQSKFDLEDRVRQIVDSIETGRITDMHGVMALVPETLHRLSCELLVEARPALVSRQAMLRQAVVTGQVQRT